MTPTTPLKAAAYEAIAARNRLSERIKGGDRTHRTRERLAMATQAALRAENALARVEGRT